VLPVNGWRISRHAAAAVKRIVNQTATTAKPASQQSSIAWSAACAGWASTLLTRLTGPSVVFLDAAKPKLLVLLGHLDEVSQALLELLRPLARRVDEGNADADVRWRKALKVLPGRLAGLERLEDVRRNLERLFVQDILQGGQYLFDYLPLLDQSPQPLLVRLGVSTLGLPH